jgi:hypothetical protein
MRVFISTMVVLVLNCGTYNRRLVHPESIRTTICQALEMLRRGLPFLSQLYRMSSMALGTLIQLL